VSDDDPGSTLDLPAKDLARLREQFRRQPTGEHADLVDELRAQVSRMQARLDDQAAELARLTKALKSAKKIEATQDAHIQMFLAVTRHLDAHAVTLCDPEGRVIYENPYGKSIGKPPDPEATLKEWSDTYGVMRSIATGEVIPEHSWPMALALQGISTDAAQVSLDGIAIIITARPHIIDGEVWAWAIWKPMAGAAE